VFAAIIVVFLDQVYTTALVHGLLAYMWTGSIVAMVVPLTGGANAET
jgi:hypothetical protein